MKKLLILLISTSGLSFKYIPKIFPTVICLATVEVVQGQTWNHVYSFSAGPSICDSTYEIFEFLSPTNSACARWGPLKLGTTKISIRTKRLFLDSLSQYPLAVVPSTANILFLTGREVKCGPLSSLPITSTQVVSALGYTPANSSGSGNVYYATNGLMKIGSEPSATITINTNSIMTVQRATDSINSIMSNVNLKADKAIGLTINSITHSLTGNQSWSLTTADVPENTNLYYTPNRVRSAFSVASGLSYNSSTGQFSNTAQDQVISLTGLGTTTTSGTYPNFTISTSSTDLSNYYTKSQTDSRYLQNETDPLWSASPSHSITSTNISNWNTAFGWGNHASVGYITSNSSNTLTNKSGNISQWTNNVGYLTSFTELDPTIPSYVKSIVSSDISNWNGKFNTPSGTTSQYVRGDGSLATFPSIPTAQVNSDWNSSSGVSQIVNKPTTLSGYGITDAQQKLNGTGFVKISGTTIIYDNNSYLTSEVDGSVSNELQTISGSGTNTLTLSNGGGSFVIPTISLTTSQVTTALGFTPLQTEIDGNTSNEIQTLSINSGNLQLSLNGGTVSTSSFLISAAQVTTGLGFVPYNGTTNPNGYISSYTETDPLFNTKFSSKTTSDLVEGTNLYFTSARTRTTVSAGTGISYNNSTGVISNLSPDQVVSIASTNTVALSVTASYPNFTLTPYAPTTQTVSRAINGSTFQCSSKLAWVYYTIRINCVATIGSASSATVVLQQSIDNGSTWEDVGQVENSNTVTLAVVLNSNTTQTSQLGGIIKPGAIVRMVTTNNGATVTFVKGQETY